MERISLMSEGGLNRLWVVGALCACGSVLALLCVSAVAWAAAPQVEEEWVTEVSASSALLLSRD
jgi:hypothetical protein